MPVWWNGRHARLKIECPSGRAGSSPATGTNFMDKKELVTIDANGTFPKAVDKKSVPLSMLLACHFFTFYDDGTYLNHKETRVRTWKIEGGILHWKLNKSWGAFDKRNNDEWVKILSHASAERALFDNDI